MRSRRRVCQQGRMRRSIPFDVGAVHFVGIGGIGMSGIAEVMLNLGYQVSGSDMKASANTDRLAKRGAKIMIGHKAENIEGVGALVISTAIKGGNPEVDAARARAIPVVRRADMLAELIRLKWTVAIAGTHGKTTTTSMVAALLDGVGLDPTVINGGVINAYASNAKLGQGEWMVVEADESDGTFTKLRPTVCIVTNIDPEHMDHYGSMEALRKGFDTFVENLPFYGFAVLCADHPEVQALASRPGSAPHHLWLQSTVGPVGRERAAGSRRIGVRSRAALARRDGPDALGWAASADGGTAQCAELAGGHCGRA